MFWENVLKIIENPKNRTTGAFARNSNKSPTLLDDTACKFCIVGAIRFVAKDLTLAAKKVNDLENLLFEGGKGERKLHLLWDLDSASQDLIIEKVRILNESLK